MSCKKYLYLLILILLTGCNTKTYTVSFNTDGGTMMDSVIVTKGEKLKNIIPPEKEGYLFVNWLKDGMEYKSEYPVNEDIILTANWVEAPEIHNYYQVIFINDGSQEKISVKENETVTPPKAKEIENYLFLGWFSGDEKFDFSTKITKNISLTAKYELNLVTITYNLDGGIGLAMETIPKNETLSIPNTPFKPGYKFLKWMLKNEEFSFDTPITKNIELTAIWEKIEYVTVEFDTDGGTDLDNIQIEKYSKLSNVEIPEKEGYTFTGWILDGETFNLDTIIEKNIVLKATYKQNEISEIE